MLESSANRNDSFAFDAEDFEELQGSARFAFLLFSGAVLLAFLVISSVHHVPKVAWLPESLIAVGCGALLGFALWALPAFGGAGFLEYTLEDLAFASFLNLIAMPSIIFEAGWSLRLRDFFSQLGFILIFAILGTVISVVVTASLIQASKEFHGVRDARTAWAYASLISSVDPVATLATFGHLNVDRLLFILVFGESQINDAVAITLFDAFTDNNAGTLELISKTCQYLFGSIALGLALAVAYILLLRGTGMKHCSAQQTLFLFTSSTFTYQLADTVGMSGIITVFFCSIMLSAYAGPHLSSDGIVLFSFLLKQAASMCDMLIFLFVGIKAVQVSLDDVALSLWLMLFVLVSRAAAVFPLGLLSNGIKALVSRRLPAESRNAISWKHMVMMWHGGVCRGGVSLWMATELGGWVDEANSVTGLRQRLINATFILICTFLLFFGGTTSLFMTWLRLPMGDAVPFDTTLYRKEDKIGYGWRLRMWLDKTVLRPLLIGHKMEQEGQSSLDAVLQEAHSLQEVRRQSSHHAGLQERLHGDLADVFELFGGDDPAHLDIMESESGASVHEEEEEEEDSGSSSD